MEQMQGKLDPHKAVDMAKSIVRDLFELSGGPRLEEVEFDDTSNPHHWRLTVSFRRRTPGQAVTRVFKVVRIKDVDGQVVSITDRAFLKD